jgi:uncharacterized protein YgiM (DUF1202 family)
MSPVKRRWVCPLSTLIVLLILSGVALAEKLYVIVKSAKVRSGITSLDAITDTVHYGDAVESIGKENEWVRVETKSKAQGLIHVSKLSSSQPGADQSSYGIVTAIVRSGASQPTVSAGARGLDKVAEGYADGSGISSENRAAVDKMTSYQIDDKQLEAFLKEGGLGDYAK